MEQKDFSYFLVGMENGTATMETSTLCFIKTKTHTYNMTQQSNSRVFIYPREMKTDIHTKRWTLMLTVHYSDSQKNGNNPNIHKVMNGKQNAAYPYNGMDLAINRNVT